MAGNIKSIKYLLKVFKFANVSLFMFLFWTVMLRVFSVFKLYAEALFVVAFSFVCAVQAVGDENANSDSVGKMTEETPKENSSDMATAEEIITFTEDINKLLAA